MVRCSLITLSLFVLNKLLEFLLIMLIIVLSPFVWCYYGYCLHSNNVCFVIQEKISLAYMCLNLLNGNLCMKELLFYSTKIIHNIIFCAIDYSALNRYMIVTEVLVTIFWGLYLKPFTYFFILFSYIVLKMSSFIQLS